MALSILFARFMAEIIEVKKAMDLAFNSLCEIQFAELKKAEAIVLFDGFEWAYALIYR